MADISKVEEAVQWYSQCRPFYHTLAKKVESIIREVLDTEKINYYNVSSRAKEIDNYREKASKEQYKEPLSEIMDMAGIRVITYTDSDTGKVSEIVKQAFEIHPEHSIDKSVELGIDRVGYRGIHYIASLGKDRLRLPENRLCKGYIFEIQIRSILQHAWAEFEHDRNYKFAGVLPKKIRRRLSVVAGGLEIIDREFNYLSKAIDDYTQAIAEMAERGDLSASINSTSLRAYMTKKLASLIEKKLVAPTFVDADDTIIAELLNMGVNSLEGLDKMFPEKYLEKAAKAYSGSSPANFVGALRNIMIAHDPETYFEKAWNNDWNMMVRESIDLLRSYGIDVDKYAKKYKFKLSKPKSE